MANSETELKLAVRPQDLSGLALAPSLLGHSDTHQIETVYYDTPDHLLGRRAVTLRVRQQNGHFIQTVKTAGLGQGLAPKRGEWEEAIAGPLPNLAAIADQEARDCLGMLDPATLGPLFTSHVKRTTRLIERGQGGAIEVAIDTGEIRTPDGASVPVSEVELELKSGETQQLFDLALELNHMAPLRIELQTKAERGYALAEGTASGAVKAGKLALDPDSHVAEALQDMLRHCLHHLVRNQPAALESRNPEGVHQMRVAMRRLRAIFFIFKKLLPAAEAGWLADEAKALTGTLGPPRDWDVFLADLVKPVFAEMPQEADVAALMKATQAQREAAYDEAIASLQGERYGTFILRLSAWVEGQGWLKQSVSKDSARLFAPVAKVATKLLDRSYRQVMKRGEGLGNLTPEGRHKLRISIKKLRYASEFFQTLFPHAHTTRALKQMTRLQDQLGHLNDVATAHRLLSSLESRTKQKSASAESRAVARAGGVIIGWHANSMREREPALLECWADFMASKPFWLNK